MSSRMSSPRKKAPKTPSRGRTAGSQNRVPFTPSSLVSGLSSLKLSPSKPAPPSNPFLKRKSPQKGSVGFAQLQAGANRGFVQRGGIESKLEVVSADFVGLKTSVSDSLKQEVANIPKGAPKHGFDDRFLPNREAIHPGHTLAAPASQSASPGHTHRLAESLGILPETKRVLTFHESAPAPSTDPTLALQRQLARPLYSRPAGVGTSTGAVTNKARRIPTTPDRVLEAPGFVDDYYLNLISWSCSNELAVALGDNIYIWSAVQGKATHLGTAPEGSYISSVDFSGDGTYLGVGVGNGDVEVWDIETNTRLRVMEGHQAQVAAVHWNEHLITSGCGDGSIWHHDVRVARHKVMELLGHTGEVCGLKWRPDGELLASGGNDNVVNCWDGRAGSVGEGHRGQPKWTKRNHTAAVKAIAWCPWQSNLLASGGGTGDATVHFWSSTTGARINSLQTPAQVTSVHFSPHSKELFTTHGFPTNSIMLHTWPSFDKVAEIRDAHDARVLCSAVGPAGDVVATAAGDEVIKLWKLWELPSKKSKPKSMRHAEVVDKSLRSIR